MPPHPWQPPPLDAAFQPKLHAIHGVVHARYNTGRPPDQLGQEQILFI